MLKAVDKTAHRLLCLIAIAFITLAVAGAMRRYSPVPFWDMWDGYLGFYTKLTSGDSSVLWSQHNEHRIVLARLFFYLDIAWFGGRSWFLIAANYVLVAISCSVFYLYAKQKNRDLVRYLVPFLFAWLFFWAQHENLTWAFQSQFILASLLPLIAVYFLFNCAVAAHSTRYFVLSLFFGILSLGTMANGLLALPVMTAYAAAARLSSRRILILACLSVVGAWLYFHNYATPGGHAELKSTLFGQPLRFFQYIAIYIGSPFYFILRGISGAINIAAIAGGAFILTCAWLAFKALRRGRDAALDLALLSFILYIGGTAAATASGRLLFGLDQALSSRYATPALMAWAAFFIVCFRATSPTSSSIQRSVRFLLLAIAGAMLPQQMSALAPQHAVLSNKMLAALALELGIKDQEQIGWVFPSTQAALSIANPAVLKNLSVFGMYPIRDSRESIGKKRLQSTNSVSLCQGALDGTQKIAGDERYVRIHGWIYDPATKKPPAAIEIVDSQGVVRGVALTGLSRPDVADAVENSAGFSGLSGYVQHDFVGAPALIVDKQGVCAIRSVIPDTRPRISSYPYIERTAPA